MRTRRRPVLQDKTPGNTPQKPKPKSTRSAKPTLVPVVEIKTNVRRSRRGKQTNEEKLAQEEEAEEAESTVPEPPQHEVASPKPVPRKRGRPRKLSTAGGRRVENEKPAETQVPTRARAQRGTRTRIQPERESSRNDTRIIQSTQPKTTRGRLVDHPGQPQTVEEESVVEEVEEMANVPEPPGADHRSADDQGLRTLPSPESPTAAHRSQRRAPGPPASGSHPPVHFAPPSPLHEESRSGTPNSIPIADDDSTASDAVRALLATPSPARIIRAPIPVESTPLGRLPPLEESLRPFYARGRHDSSIRRWNALVPHTFSPLPPSSPPPASPTQVPIASSSQPYYAPTHHNEEPQEDQENTDEDDPFGLLAAEKKLKARRQVHSLLESSRAPGGTRAPLGTLAWDEIPSAVPIPDKLPTPLPSDDDEHNIDDLYLDVDPIRSDHENSDILEPEDKENVPTAEYDLAEDKENMKPPHTAFDEFTEDPQPPDDNRSLEDLDADMEDQDENEENDPHAVANTSIPPLLLASARKPDALAQLIASPSSSDASPTHALRTPHKHRSAHQRSPLPTPHFSSDDGGILDAASPLTARTRNGNATPSPSKPGGRPVPGAARSAVAGPSTRPLVRPAVRKPLATLEMEPPEPEPGPEPRRVAGRGRKRKAETQESDDSDPRAAVRRLEALLPKRAKTRAASPEKARRRPPASKDKNTGKGKGKAPPSKAKPASRKGKERENAPRSSSSSVDGSEDEDEGDDVTEYSSPPKAATRRGRGRGRPPGRGRGRGRGGAPVRGRSTSRGKGKGKEEPVDPEEEEKRTRERQERIDYFRKLQEYSLEKEDVYVI